jgi:hydrogenase maturation factor
VTARRPITAALKGPLAGPSPSPACGPEGGCIKCSDEGVPMRVLQAGPEQGLALCADDAGRRSEVMIALVEPVTPGDRLLVHAGTALVRLTPHPEATG